MITLAEGLEAMTLAVLLMLPSRLLIFFEKATQPPLFSICFCSWWSSHSKLSLSEPTRPTQVQLKWLKSLARTKGRWALLGTVQRKDGNWNRSENWQCWDPWLIWRREWDAHSWPDHPHSRFTHVLTSLELALVIHFLHFILINLSLAFDGCYVQVLLKPVAWGVNSLS